MKIMNNKFSKKIPIKDVFIIFDTNVYLNLVMNKDLKKIEILAEYINNKNKKLKNIVLLHDLVLKELYSMLTYDNFEDIPKNIIHAIKLSYLLSKNETFHYLMPFEYQLAKGIFNIEDIIFVNSRNNALYEFYKDDKLFYKNKIKYLQELKTNKEQKLQVYKDFIFEHFVKVLNPNANKNNWNTKKYDKNSKLKLKNNIDHYIDEYIKNINLKNACNIAGILNPDLDKLYSMYHIRLRYAGLIHFLKEYFTRIIETGVNKKKIANQFNDLELAWNISPIVTINRKPKIVVTEERMFHNCIKSEKSLYSKVFYLYELKNLYNL